MYRMLPVVSVVLGVAVPSMASLVWESNFNSGTDGVVNVRTDNPAVTMIGPNTGGQLTIVTTGRKVTQSNKAGRPLPTNVGANDSFSAYYKWTYSSLQDNGLNAVEELAGFISPESPHSTRQMMGADFEHYMDDSGNYHISMGLRWASEGNVGSGRDFPKGNDINFGPTPPVDIPFQLAVGYDGSTKVLSANLYDGSGTLLVSVSGDIRTFDNLGVPPDDPSLQLEMDQLNLADLGWSDFISGVTQDKTDTWSADTLAYYNDASGAFDRLVPEPSAAVIFIGVMLPLVRKRRSRR